MAAGVALLAAIAALASPPGQGAIRAAVDEVRSWFVGEGAVIESGGLQFTLEANGIVTSAVSDGGGGWFIAGGFTELNGETRAHLARIRADGTLDPRWRPELAGAGDPSLTWAKLARLGERLYVAGTFTSVNGEERGQVVALDVETGELASGWSGELHAVDAVNAIAASEGHVYVALTGAALIGGRPYRCLVALDAISGEPSPEFQTPLAPAGPLRCLSAIAATPQALLAGGTFKDGEGELGTIAALDPRTGRPLAGFRPPVIACSDCAGAPPVIEALAVSQGRLYVGGTFTSAANEPRSSLLALDPETGALLAGFSPQIRERDGSAGDVLALAAAENELYVGGRFQQVDGKATAGLAVLNPAGALLPHWHPTSNSDYILALAVSGTRQLVVGARGSA